LREPAPLRRLFSHGARKGPPVYLQLCAKAGHDLWKRSTGVLMRSLVMAGLSGADLRMNPVVPGRVLKRL
jgi:hypothetical protein